MHLEQLLAPYLSPNNSNHYPTLDRHISTYFKEHKSLGSHERRTIYDKAYDLIRYHHYLNHLCKGSKDMEMRLRLMHSSDFYTEMDNSKLAKYSTIITQMDPMLLSQRVRLIINVGCISALNNRRAVRERHLSCARPSTPGRPSP